MTTQQYSLPLAHSFTWFSSTLIDFYPKFPFDTVLSRLVHFLWFSFQFLATKTDERKYIYILMNDKIFLKNYFKGSVDGSQIHLKLLHCPYVNSLWFPSNFQSFKLALFHQFIRRRRWTITIKNSECRDKEKRNSNEGRKCHRQVIILWHVDASKCFD